MSSLPESATPHTTRRRPASDDARIASYARTRDGALLEQLIHDNLGLVHVIARRHVLYAPAAVLDYDDLVQCGIIAFVEALHKFDPARGVPFGTWAGQKIEWAVRDAIRRVSTTGQPRAVDLDAVFGHASVQISDGTDIIDAALSKRASLTLRRAVSHLPLRDSLVVLLVVHGLSFAKIAQCLGISETTARKDHARALRSLRCALVKTLGEYDQ